MTINGLSPAVLSSVKAQIQTLPPAPLLQGGRPDLVVASILDPFSFECFKYECTLIPLHVSKWRRQLHKVRPHFLLVESAWKDRRWGLYGLNPSRAGCEIAKLVAYCRQAGIPTVFWNKEDPPNYEHFLGTAKLFDHIFTTDAGCIPLYQRDAGHSRVYSLPFAAQPALHNPVGSNYTRKRNVAFAGTYYHNPLYPDRIPDTQLLLLPAIPYGLHIYDRPDRASRDRFPDVYRPYIVGQLSYAEMVKAYRLYKVFLNVNSVKHSPTMFSRRVYELLASGANVITSYSRGIAGMFPDLVPIAYTKEQTARILHQLLTNKLCSEKLSVLGVREVYSRHLYKHRFHDILSRIGIRGAVEEPGVMVVAFVSSPESLERVLDQFQKQRWGRKELMLLTHRPNMVMAPAFAKAGTNVRMFIRPEGESPVQMLQAVSAYSPLPYISYFHEAHYYAPYYLTDLMHAFQYTGADLAGKSAYYAYSPRQAALYLCNEHNQNRYVHALNESAWVMKKETLTKMALASPLAGLTIAGLLDCCIRSGMKLYSADKFNFVMHTDAPQPVYSLETAAAALDYKGTATV